MPLTHVRCFWLSDQPPAIPVKDCRGCALSGKNPCGYPSPLIQVMTRDRDPAVVGCSATMFDGCPREHGIKKNLDWSIDPRKAYVRAHGTLLHEGAEACTPRGEEVAAEKRMARDYTLLDGRTARITAQMDAMYFGRSPEAPPFGRSPEASPFDGLVVRVQDYKDVDSLTDNALAKKVARYRPQFSIQRWILVGLGFDVERVDIQFLAKKDKRTVNLWPDGDKMLPDAFLLTLEETELYLEERLPALLDSLEGHYAPPLSERRELWRCFYCDVANECQELYGSEPIPAFKHR